MARLRFEEEMLAVPGVPIVARDVKVSGSDVEVGQALAELAIARYRLRPEDLLGDGRYVRARRTYFRRNYPTHLRRMRGVARAFGLHPDDDRFDFSILGAPGPATRVALSGESTYEPPWANQTGHGMLSRCVNLPRPLEAPLELYVMEWRSAGSPHGSIAVHVDDLLSGAVQGMNAAGLAVSAIAAGRAGSAIIGQPARVSAIGLHELQLVRFVLDTCRTVDDAQAALLAARDFSMAVAARYLVADADGRSFAYEAEPNTRAQRIVDGGGDRQTIGTRGQPGHEQSGWRCVIDQERRSLEVFLLSETASVGMPLTAVLGSSR